MLYTLARALRPCSYLWTKHAGLHSALTVIHDLCQSFGLSELISALSVSSSDQIVSEPAGGETPELWSVTLFLTCKLHTRTHHEWSPGRQINSCFLVQHSRSLQLIVQSELIKHATFELWFSDLRRNFLMNEIWIWVVCLRPGPGPAKFAWRN